MSALLADSTLSVLTGLALTVMIGVVLWAARRSRSLTVTANRLVYLALDGRADEARILARRESRELRPVLDALGGEISAPSARPLLLDAACLVGISVLPLLTFLVGLGAMAPDHGAERVTSAASLLAALAVLLPATAAAAAAVVELSRRAARAVRGATITLLARSVKATVDAELAEALKRGSLRDPRGA